MICWNCNREDLPDRPGRLEVCPECGGFLHSCYNCKFYTKNAHHECSEPQAEWVRDKNSANFCGYFAGRESPLADGSVQGKLLSKNEAEKKWEQLFKKKGN